MNSLTVMADLVSRRCSLREQLNLKIFVFKLMLIDSAGLFISKSAHADRNSQVRKYCGYLVVYTSEDSV